MTINFPFMAVPPAARRDLFADIIAKLFSRGKKNDIIYFVLLSLWSECMTETAFLQYTGYVLAFFAVWIVARCARLEADERYVPEVWGYLELPDGTSRADRALGVHSRPGEGLGHRAHRRGDRAQPRRHPALRRGRVDALRARRRQGRLAERQGRHGRRAAPRRRYDQAWRNGAALSRAGRRAARHIAAQAPPDRGTRCSRR